MKMNNIYLLITVFTFATVQANGCGSCNKCDKCPEPQQYLFYSSFEDCEGKDSANFTLLSQGTLSDNCASLQSKTSKLITCGSNGRRGTDQLQLISSSLTPAGAYQQYEALYVATGGPLDGKYLYEKTILLSAAYSKKCGSILGYSYVSTKSSTLLINDKLELQVLVSPTGGFDAFKKGCTTVCRGKGYLF